MSNKHRVVIKLNCLQSRKDNKPIRYSVVLWLRICLRYTEVSINTQSNEMLKLVASISLPDTLHEGDPAHIFFWKYGSRVQLIKMDFNYTVLVRWASETNKFPTTTKKKIINKSTPKHFRIFMVLCMQKKSNVLNKWVCGLRLFSHN